MSTRYYKSWDTIETSYVPKQRSYSYHHQISRPHYNRPITPYPRSYPVSSSYSSSYSSSSSPSSSYSGYGANFDFISGRYSTSGGRTRLGDAYRSENLYRHLDNLVHSSDRLRQDYRNRIDSYSSQGLPYGYGAPKYMGSQRQAPSERYGMNYGRVQLDSRGNRRYNNAKTPEYEESTTHYERNKLEDYQGSVGNVLYNKDMHKGQYEVHEEGPRTVPEYDIPEPGKPKEHHLTATTEERGAGLKKSASRGDLEAVAAATSDDEEDLEVGRKDSGIEGSEDEFDGAFEEVEINVEEEDVAEIEPEPEVCVYNEISPEEFAEIQAAVAEEEVREKPLFSSPPIASVTTQLLHVDKVVGIFKSTDDPDRPMSLSPVPGMSSCYVTSPCTSPRPSLTGDAPQDLAINELSFGMQQSQGADETADPVEVKLELEDPEINPLGVSAKVVQVGEETIITETVEEVVEEIQLPEDAVPAEVHLTIAPEKTEGETAVVAPETTAETVTEESKEKESKAEETKAEETQAAEPKVEEAKVEEPKVEEAKIEEPKVETKAEETEAAEPKVEEPKVEEPKVEEAKVEEPKVETKAEETQAAEAKVNEPKAEEPKIEEAKVEEPKVEKAKAEEPKEETKETTESLKVEEEDAKVINSAEEKKKEEPAKTQEESKTGNSKSKLPFNKFEKKTGKAAPPKPTEVEPKKSKFGERKFGSLNLNKFEGKSNLKDRQLPPKKKLF